MQKGTTTLQKMCYRSKMYLKVNSSTILTVIGAAGVITTSVMAVRATPKALKLLEKAADEKGEELTKIEIITVAGPAYIPSVVFGVSTIACIFGANILNKRRQAALTSAYALLDNAFKEYKNKVKEVLGDETDAKIRDSITLDKCESNELSVIPNGKTLFFEEYSGRFFESTIQDVQNAEYHFNRNFVLRGYASLNELYDFLGLPETDFGEEFGWSDSASVDYGYQWIDFEHRPVVQENGSQYCYSISMPFPPTEDYMA